MLGLGSGEDTIIVAEGIGTKFIARRSDLGIEGYDWGGLTSGSSLQALWVLLLPGGGAAPPWYYILQEAEIQGDGRRLGQTGGRIVAEVFLGLLEKDASSYLRNKPD